MCEQDSSKNNIENNNKNVYYTNSILVDDTQLPTLNKITICVDIKLAYNICTNVFEQFKLQHNYSVPFLSFTKSKI